jgi:lysozyme family protein
MAGPMLALTGSTSGRATRRIVVHRKPRTGPSFRALSKGVDALTLEQFVTEMNLGKKAREKGAP